MLRIDKNSSAENSDECGFFGDENQNNSTTENEVSREMLYRGTASNKKIEKPVSRSEGRQLNKLRKMLYTILRKRKNVAYP